MNNDPNVPNASIQTELQSEVGARDERTAPPKAVLSRTTMAGALIAAAIAALAASLVHTDQQAAANSAGVVARAPSTASVPLSVPLDSGEVHTFRFGFLEFEYQSGGVPGFSALPPESRAQ